ncbi:hypothetical protein MHB50_16090 [Siminovitchia sp. FSL H7-0308]|uniref:fluoroquinolone export ABC transporter permease subunit n=1 Tax=Siminovitchia sp. FSL H7-0308 TaxID=2921432 RepID=UPI0030ED765A
MKTWMLIKNDLKFQYRHGFYMAYFVLTLMLLMLLSLFSGLAKEQAGMILLLTEISSFGSTFVAATIVLEKEQRLYDTLFVTPINIHSFLQAKILSLAAPAFISGTILFAVSFGLNTIRLEFIAGIFLTSILFSLLGLALATRCQSINGFILLSLPFGLVLAGLPIVHHLQLFPMPFSIILPAQGALRLLNAGFEQTGWKDVLLAVLLLAGWVLVFYVWAERWFSTYIVQKEATRN